MIVNIFNDEDADVSCTEIRKIADPSSKNNYMIWNLV
jgi:hypothetical protein